MRAGEECGADDMTGVAWKSVERGRARRLLGVAFSGTVCDHGIVYGGSNTLGRWAFYDCRAECEARTC